MKWLDVRELWRVARFGMVGGFNTMATFGFYSAMVWFGLNFNVALGIEYAIGIVIGFFLNLRITFGDREGVDNRLGHYIACYVVVFAVNLTLLNLLVSRGIPPIPGQAIALIFSSATSYVLQHRWVFRHDGTQSADV
jgi:putative flippase GtrA